MLKNNYQRIVIKVGSSLFRFEYVLENLIRQIAQLVKTEKREVVLVSSGAIFYGMSLLGLKSRPNQLARLQATAALGQIELMNIYRKGFALHGIKSAQILLTWDDFNQRQRYLNAKNTIAALLKSEIIPVINENDTVSTEEIKFGDNDRLSALVANLIEADILIILSDVDGLMNNEKKEIVRIIDEISPQIKKMACPTDKNTCVGGMITKLEAGQIATDSGIYCLIANGKKKDILSLALATPEVAGTLFLPKKDRMEARKRWIAFSTKPKGQIYVDRGAEEALAKNFRSLLSPGIIEIEGDFIAGDAVSVVDAQGRAFARGICSYSVEELRRIKGKRAKKEVIHRDNLVIFNKE